MASAASALRVVSKSAVPRVGGASVLSTVQRRFAGAGYAHMKVKKNNWVEQNEVMRENQFYTWQIGKKNIVGLVMFAVVIPLGMRQIVMSEMQLRDETAGRPQRERV